MNSPKSAVPKRRNSRSVLLDTNVWRYIADANCERDVARASIRNRLRILIAPAVVFETQDMQDKATRSKILKIITNPLWGRLMPETYSESEEIKSEIRRLRPNWLNSVPSLSEKNRLKHNWSRRKGGFWDGVRDEIEPPVTDESIRSNQEQQLARDESAEIRQRTSKLPQKAAITPLQYVDGLPEPGTLGWDGSPVEYWRVPSLTCLQRELLVYASPYREWLDGEVDIGTILANTESFNKLWLHELDSKAVPRQWLRGAFEFLQAWHRVTPGTPVDAQLATHLVEADHFISADKNFVRFAQRCQEEAPFSVATAHLISGGDKGVGELLHLLETI